MRMRVLPPLLAVIAALVPAGAARAAPRVSAHLGFDGLVREGRPVPVRLDVTNPGEAWSGRFHLAETWNDVPHLTWEFPLEVPRGARQVRWVTVSPAILDQVPIAATGLSTWLDGGTPVALGPHQTVSPSSQLVLVLTVTDIAPLSEIRETLAPRGNVEVRLPSLPPEHLPVDPVAWEAVDAIVVERVVADRVSRAAWEAIRDRVLGGATLLLHGTGRWPDVVPAELLPADPAASTTTWVEPASGQVHSASVLAPRPGSRPVSIGGRTLEWGMTQALGRGRVTLAGVDLRHLRGSLDDQRPLWAALLGMTAPGDLSILPPAPLMQELRGLGATRHEFRTSRVEALLIGTLVLCAVVLVAVHALARRRPRRALLEVPAACVVVAFPLLLVGGLSRLAVRHDAFVLEEHFPATGRVRTTHLLTLQDAGASPRERTELPGWPPRLLPEEVALQGQLAGGRLVGPPERAVVGLNAVLGGHLSVEVAHWAGASSPPITPSTDRPVQLEAPFTGAWLVERGALVALSEDGLSATESVEVIARQLRGRPGRHLVAVAEHSRAGLLTRGIDRIVVVHLPESP